MESDFAYLESKKNTWFSDNIKQKRPLCLAYEWTIDWMVWLQVLFLTLIRLFHVKGLIIYQF